MAVFAHSVGAQTYRFDSLKDVMAKASPARSGDFLAGNRRQQRRRARRPRKWRWPTSRSSTSLQEALIPYESDEVTRLIIDTHDKQAAFAVVSHLTVGGFRDWLLSDAADEASLRALAPGLTPEMAARCQRSCACRIWCWWRRKSAWSRSFAAPWACAGACRPACNPTIPPTNRPASPPAFSTVCCTATAMP
jgi:ethanolamine ammonia-lyase large subunit